jgi:Protein of unknown function (DUF3551)
MKATAGPTIARLMIAGAALAAAMSLDIPSSRAFGDAPWCAVMEVGTGEMYWDCEYRTVEQCEPNVVAGNRGFCNLNPWPGGYASAAAQSRHRKRHWRR